MTPSWVKGPEMGGAFTPPETGGPWGILGAAEATLLLGRSWGWEPAWGDGGIGNWRGTPRRRWGRRGKPPQTKPVVETPPSRDTHGGRDALKTDAPTTTKQTPLGEGTPQRRGGSGALGGADAARSPVTTGGSTSGLSQPA